MSVCLLVVLQILPSFVVCCLGIVFAMLTHLVQKRDIVGKIARNIAKTNKAFQNIEIAVKQRIDPFRLQKEGQTRRQFHWNTQINVNTRFEQFLNRTTP